MMQNWMIRFSDCNASMNSTTEQRYHIFLFYIDKMSIYTYKQQSSRRNTNVHYSLHKVCMRFELYNSIKFYFLITVKLIM